MIITDFHTHSHHSGDSEANMNDMIAAAAKAGIQHYCFTEHCDYEYMTEVPDYIDEPADFSLDTKAYAEEFYKIKEGLDNACSSSNVNTLNNPGDGADFNNNTNKHAGKETKAGKDIINNINIYHGIEVGMQPHVAGKNRALVGNGNFDFVIGSVHVIDGLDPYYREYWADKTETNVMRRYFQYIYENILAFNDFDVLGHLDYVVRYCEHKDANYSYALYADEIDAILKWTVENGKGIEINTGGLKNGLKYPNPTPDILKRYRELGGEIITVGSDAHRPEYVAYKFDIAEAVLKDAGFKYYCAFKDRKPSFTKL